MDMLTVRKKQIIKKEPRAGLFYIYCDSSLYKVYFEFTCTLHIGYSLYSHMPLDILLRSYIHEPCNNMSFSS